MFYKTYSFIAVFMLKSITHLLLYTDYAYMLYLLYYLSICRYIHNISNKKVIGIKKNLEICTTLKNNMHLYNNLGFHIHIFYASLLPCKHLRITLFKTFQLFKTVLIFSNKSA